MSDTVSLELIGRNLRDIQVELRALHSRMDRIEARLDRLEVRMDHLEAMVEAKLDIQTMLIDKRFDQLVEMLKEKTDGKEA